MYKSQWSEYDMLKPKLAPCSPPEPGTFTSVNKINGKRYDKKSVVIVCHDGFLYIGRRLKDVLEVVNAKLPKHRQLSHRHLYVMAAREAGGYHKGAWARRRGGMLHGGRVDNRMHRLLGARARRLGDDRVRTY